MLKTPPLTLGVTLNAQPLLEVLEVFRKGQMLELWTRISSTSALEGGVRIWPYGPIPTSKAFQAVFSGPSAA